MAETKNPQQPAINIELSEEVAEGIYSNLAIISHSNAEFVVDFIRLTPNVPKAKVKARIILTPQHAKRLLIAAERSMYGTPIETLRYSFLRAEFLAPHLAEKAYDPRSIYYIPRYSQNFTRRTTHNNRPNTS